MIHDSCPICGSNKSHAILLPKYRKVIASQYRQIASRPIWHCDAHHEAGHVIAARAFGVIVPYVTVVGNPHAAIVRSGHGYFANLIISAAGDVATSVCANEEFIPLWGDLRRAVDRAQGSKVGSCDRCFESRLLVLAMPELSRLEIIDAWYGIFEVTTDFFKTVAWRDALERLAAELNDSGLLEREAIEKIIDQFSVVSAKDDVLCKYENDSLRVSCAVLSRVLPALTQYGEGGGAGVGT